MTRGDDMFYQVSDVFHQKIDIVTQAFIRIDQMKQWQPQLVRVETASGVWPNEGFVGYLIYQTEDYKSKMKVIIKENKLPNKLVFVYEVPGVINQCDYFLKKVGDDIHYHMDVTFEFADGVMRDPKPFENQTRLL